MPAMLFCVYRLEEHGAHGALLQMREGTNRRMEQRC
jgi:hypothetical protein